MHAKDYKSHAVKQLREDLALALRAAAHHGLGEGICNHFSADLPDGSSRFLILVDEVALQLEGERLQSSLFFEALRRTL